MFYITSAAISISHPRALFHTEIKAKRLGLDLE